MSRFLSVAVLGLSFGIALTAQSLAGDAAAGGNVFKKCKSCHAAGEGATNKVGPVLNNLLGRTAGTAPGFRYSKAMAEAGKKGLVWQQDTLSDFLHGPKAFVKGTKMAFAGLKKQEDIENLIAYLATFSSQPAEQASGSTDGAGKASEDKVAASSKEPMEMANAAKDEPSPGADGSMPATGAGAHFKLGRKATDEEVAAWDFDVRPDGLGLPEGHGTVNEGMAIFDQNCATCHGDFGEGIDRWPVLSGGHDTLTNDRPVKTIGSYWPYLSTVYDYIHRAMPFGNTHTLSDNDYYALTAYLLYLNDIVSDEDFELNKENFTSIRLPNENGFIPDDRAQEAHNKDRSEPCMSNCLPGQAKITMHAAVLDVTPEGNDDSGKGSID